MSIKVGIAPDSWGVWFPEHRETDSKGAAAWMR